MKLLGNEENSDPSNRPQIRTSQDDAAVGYGFHPSQENEFPAAFVPKRWAGTEEIIDNQEKWKYPPIYQPTIQQQPPFGNQNQQNAIKPPPLLNHHHSQIPNPLQSNHLNPTTMLSQTMNMNNSAHHQHNVQPGPPPMYDHNMMNPMNGLQKAPSEFIYLNQQHAPPPHHLNQLQNQYLPSRSNITSSATKKLWDNKTDMKTTNPLAPLQMPLQGNEHQMWPKSEHQTGAIWTKEQQMWSTQDNSGLIPRRNDNTMTGILSPRDSTGGLGVKMVEYVLGGSPTNKESPLALDSRLRNLKIDEVKGNDDKENASPFESNGLKKDDPNSNGTTNGIDDDKGFNRTPGSRQPSPAEEHLARNSFGLEQGINVGGFSQPMMQHMLNNHDQQQMGSSSFHPQHMSHHIMNGGMVQNPMVGQSHDSPANILQQQQQHNYEQLLRSQNPALTNTTNGQPMPPLQMTASQQQFLAQQNAAYAAQAQAQAAPYMMPSQDGNPFMATMLAPPSYYGVPPWVYPASLIPQQGTQPRRPLTPSQGAENQPFVLQPTFYDQNGCAINMMGHRTGTPMRLVSPAPVTAPVLVPGAAPRPPQIYQPAQQGTPQTIYSQQNNNNVGGLQLNTGLTTRRDSFDRNTSAFSPSLEYSSGNMTGSSVRKWPTAFNGTLGASSSSPVGISAPLTPPPPANIINRAPGAETKYRNIGQLPVGIPSSTSGNASNNMFGSSNSLFSKLNSGGIRSSQNPSNMPVAIPSTASNNVANAENKGRSRLLEEFRNQRYPNLQLRDLSNHIVEFSQDQHGSRFIQQKLERATAAEKQMVFNEIISSAYSLMTDVFGNYVIQKFFEYGTQEQRSALASQVKGNVLNLALQMYGCRVIQKALESIPSEQQQEIVKELEGHVLKCVKDQNGNHVVQKCIECVESNALQFVINAFNGQIFTLSTHPYGCRVIQRILEHCTSEQTNPILSELHINTEKLIQDQYGNYVIQHVLEHGKPEDKSAIIKAVLGKVLTLSQHKFASNVVEKCVTHATRAERNMLIDEVCLFNDAGLQVMMKDQYANYVVQKMIDVSEPTQRKTLLHKIRPHMNSLRKYTYGKHIIAKLEKFSLKSGVGGISATSSTVPTTTVNTESVASSFGPNGI